MTPMGFPTTVALLPMLVAKTVISSKGTSGSPNLAAKEIPVDIMKRIEVTSSTRAAERAAIPRKTAISLTAPPLPRCRTLSTTTSKNRRSSRKPMTIIMQMRKTITSSEENSMNVGTSISLAAIRIETPTSAKASLNLQKRRVPPMMPVKTETATDCCGLRPAAIDTSSPPIGIAG